MERTLKRKGSCPSNCAATLSPSAHWFSCSQPESSVPERWGGWVIVEGPFLCVPIHN